MGDEGLKHRERAACTPETVATLGFNRRLIFLTG